MDYFRLISDQRRFYEEGHTRPASFRKKQLNKLRSMLTENEKEISEAVYKDLRKPEMEVMTAEIMTVLDEIDYHLKHLGSWMKSKSVRANMISLPSKNEMRRYPYGLSLIIGTWNYPVNLVLLPLVGAISGGNCAVIKTSELAPKTSAMMRRLISETFEQNYIAVAEGAADVAQELLDQPFDKIFFTGSTRVGKIVMEKAAQQLIPVTLELGGKSPAVVHSDADVKTAARRIAWGKYMNAGQTCIAPDFVLAHSEIKEELVEELKKAIRKYYGKKPEKSDDYGRIINDSHFDRITGLMDGCKILHGGRSDKEARWIEPTIVNGIDWQHPVMKEEIFGPVLPVMIYSGQVSPVEMLRRLTNPLALYIFSENEKFTESIIEQVPHGGTCVNDVVMHIANPNLPFGGMGASGMGQYHGQYSFECFTRPHAIMKRSIWPDPSFRYPPFGKKLYLLKKLFMR